MSRSVFDWNDGRPSVIAQDKKTRGEKAALTRSQRSTAVQLRLAGEKKKTKDGQTGGCHVKGA